MVVRFTRKEKLENKCVTKFFYLIILFHEEEDRRFSLTLFVDYNAMYGKAWMKMLTYVLLKTDHSLENKLSV